MRCQSPWGIKCVCEAPRKFLNATEFSFLTFYCCVYCILLVRLLRFTAAFTAFYCCVYSVLLLRLLHFTAAFTAFYCCVYCLLLLRLLSVTAALLRFTAAFTECYCISQTNFIINLRNDFVHQIYSFPYILILRV